MAMSACPFFCASMCADLFRSAVKEQNLSLLDKMSTFAQCWNRSSEAYPTVHFQYKIQVALTIRASCSSDCLRDRSWRYIDSCRRVGGIFTVLGDPGIPAPAHSKSHRELAHGPHCNSLQPHGCVCAIYLPAESRPGSPVARTACNRRHYRLMATQPAAALQK